MPTSFVGTQHLRKTQCAYLWINRALCTTDGDKCAHNAGDTQRCGQQTRTLAVRRATRAGSASSVVNRLRSVSAERSDIATLDITERREAAGQVLDVVLVGVSPSPLGAIFVLGRPALGGFTGHIVLKRTFELRPDPGQRQRFQLGNVAGLCCSRPLAASALAADSPACDCAVFSWRLGIQPPAVRRPPQPADRQAQMSYRQLMGAREGRVTPKCG